MVCAIASAADRLDVHGHGTWTHIYTGELACLYSSPRAATVKAVSGGSLWRVDRATFRGLLFNSAAARLMRFLRSVPVLTTYSEHALTHLAQVCPSPVLSFSWLRTAHPHSRSSCVPDCQMTVSFQSKILMLSAASRVVGVH